MSHFLTLVLYVIPNKKKARRVACLRSKNLRDEFNSFDTLALQLSVTRVLYLRKGRKNQRHDDSYLELCFMKIIMKYILIMFKKTFIVTKYAANTR